MKFNSINETKPELRQIKQTGTVFGNFHLPRVSFDPSYGFGVVFLELVLDGPDLPFPFCVFFQDPTLFGDLGIA